jgi:hypothetical protein
MGLLFSTITQLHNFLHMPAPPTTLIQNIHHGKPGANIDNQWCIVVQPTFTSSLQNISKSYTPSVLECDGVVTYSSLFLLYGEINESQ